LGADASIFYKLGFAGYQPHFIKWLKPQAGESLANYAKRLRVQIHDERPTLLGLSFGGLMAIEVARYIAPKEIIIINSVKTYRELPWYYRLPGKLNLHRLMPGNVLNKHPRITNYLFGLRSEADKQLLKEVISNTDTVFMKWAIDKIVKWQNNIIPGNIYHIHGEDDRILPARYVQADSIIPHGGHAMVLDKADIVNTILYRKLQ
jgi:pimeloyl-ACP methyl ester carboxylesterase